MRVSLANSGHSFSAAPGQSLLDAALAAGLNLPHSCKSGNCGSCRARLLEGRTEYPHGRPLGISAAEAADRQILLCQARACGDVVVRIPELRAADEVTIRRLPCRIERSERLSHDVIAVYLRLPAAEAFSYQPGQYIDVMLDGGRRRSFSIASPPGDARLLELHVRRVAGGEFTERLFGATPQRMLLNIEGPLGGFLWRAGDAPAVMVGGGTGLAPLLSMLKAAIGAGTRSPITLYWGVRTAADLYRDAELKALAQAAAAFRYVPVLSEADASWRGRRGLVHAAVLEDHATLAGVDIYASGPPAMIAAVRSGFVQAGADPARLAFDSFDYAPDALARQRSSASTSA